jgi:hypothetical protein
VRKKKTNPHREIYACQYCKSEKKLLQDTTAADGQHCVRVWITIEIIIKPAETLNFGGKKIYDRMCTRLHEKKNAKTMQI